MNDALGNELKVGDRIVYCTRRGSGMDLKPTTILELKMKQNYLGQDYEVAVCVNPSYTAEKKYSWSGNSPKTVTLSCPAYIARVA